MSPKLLELLSNALVVLGGVAAFVALAGLAYLLVNLNDRSPDSSSWTILFEMWLVGGALIWGICLYVAIRLRKAAKSAGA